jgi:hypothetical protein
VWRCDDSGGLGASTVYCDFEDVRKYKDAVTLARAAGVPIGLATIRVIKPGEERALLKLVADAGARPRARPQPCRAQLLPRGRAPPLPLVPTTR